MLVDLQALLAGMAGDQLNLGIGQTLRREPRQHLVPEQVWMNVLRQFRQVRVAGYDLLDTQGGEFCPLPRLKKVAVLGIRGELRFQDQSERLGEQDVRAKLKLADIDKPRMVSTSIKARGIETAMCRSARSCWRPCVSTWRNPHGSAVRPHDERNKTILGW